MLKCFSSKAGKIYIQHIIYRTTPLAVNARLHFSANVEELLRYVIKWTVEIHANRRHIYDAYRLIPSDRENNQFNLSRINWCKAATDHYHQSSNN